MTNWINQLFFAVLISSVTGTLMLGVWHLLQSFFMRFNPDLVYCTLRWVCLLYVLPSGYVAMRLTYRGWIRESSGQSTVSVFATTDMINFAFRFIAAVWFVVVCIVMAHLGITYWKFRQTLKGNVEEGDEKVIHVYRKLCREMQIPVDTFELCRNDMIRTPMIAGLIHPQIVVPYGMRLPEKEWEIILAHELSHYLHKDLWFKIFWVFITVIHCFNPAAHWLLSALDEWSENMADVSAIEQLGYMERLHIYFDCVLRIVPDKEDMAPGQFQFSTMAKTKEELDRRIDFMKAYREVKKAGSKVTAAITAAFVMVSSITSVFAGTGAGQIYDDAYQNTESLVYEKAVVADDGMVEYYADVEDLGDVQIIYDSAEDGIMPIAGPYTFNWNVTAHTRFVTKEFQVKAGGYIKASAAVSPVSKTFWLGIMDDDGHARYVSGDGALAHNFSITSTNDYRVFVQNDNSIVLNAAGGYAYGN